MWLTNSSIPEWMKPNLSNALLVAEELRGIKYVTVKEMGKRLDSTVLSWLILAKQAGSTIENIRYELDGGWNFLGTPAFLKLMLGPAPAERQL
jgi:hypothetical protein